MSIENGSFKKEDKLSTVMAIATLLHVAIMPWVITAFKALVFYCLYKWFVVVPFHLHPISYYWMLGIAWTWYAVKPMQPRFEKKSDETLDYYYARLIVETWRTLFHHLIDLSGGFILHLILRFFH